MVAAVAICWSLAAAAGPLTAAEARLLRDSHAPASATPFLIRLAGQQSQILTRPGDRWADVADVRITIGDPVVLLLSADEPGTWRLPPMRIECDAPAPTAVHCWFVPTRAGDFVLEFLGATGTRRVPIQVRG